MAASEAERTARTGQTARLVINTSSPFRLDYVRNNLRRRFGLAEDAGYVAVATLSRRWQPYAGLVYFHLLLDGLAARGDLAETR